MTDQTEDGRWPLPEGWVWDKLGEVCNIKMGQSPPSSTYNSEGVGLPFYQGKAEFGALYPIPVKWCSSPQKIADAGEILLSVRAPVGATNLNRETSCLGRGLAAIRPPAQMSSLYFLYYLRYSAQKLVDQATGTTFQAISGNVVRNHLVPVPPPSTQHLIVAEIEKQFTRLDAAVAALRRAKANLARYKAAVLKAAVEGRLVAQDPSDEPASALLARILAERRAQWEAANPRKKYVEPKRPDLAGLPELPVGWVWATVEQVGDATEQTVLTGPFGSSLGRDDFVERGVPLLTIGCLRDTGIALDKAFYVSEEKAVELDRYRVEEGDILFSRMAAVGRAGFVSASLEGALINYHLMRLRLNIKAIDPNYFIYYVRGSRAVETYIRQVNHGVTRDGINTTQLLSLPIALPPQLQQQMIVKEVDQLLSVTHAAYQVVDANLSRADRLRQAVLGRAFRGELV